MISFHFHKSDNILHVIYTGTIGPTDIIDFFEKLYSNKNLPKVLYIIQDEIEAQFEDSDVIISKAIELINKIVKRYTFIHVAIIQTAPIETAYSMIFKELVKAPNYHIEIFYSKDNALNWLKTTMNDSKKI